MISGIKRKTVCLVLMIFLITSLSGCDGPPPPKVQTWKVNPQIITQNSGCFIDTEYSVRRDSATEKIELTLGYQDGSERTLSNQDQFSGRIDHTVFFRGPGKYNFKLKSNITNGDLGNTDVFILNPMGDFFPTNIYFNYPDDLMEDYLVRYYLLLKTVPITVSEKYDRTTTLFLCEKYMELTGITFASQSQGGVWADSVEIGFQFSDGSFYYPNNPEIRRGDTLTLDSRIPIKDGTKIIITQVRHSPAPMFSHGEPISFDLYLHFKGAGY